MPSGRSTTASSEPRTPPISRSHASGWKRTGRHPRRPESSSPAASSRRSPRKTIFRREPRSWSAGSPRACVIATKPPGETFGGASIAREVNQRYGKRLRRPAQARTVATALRRMAAAGRIRQVREGRARYEALYTRGEG